MPKRNDNALYYPAAEEARQLELKGDYKAAGKVWAKANRTSRNPLNIEWSERRSDFCFMQNIRCRYMEQFNNETTPVTNSI